MMKRMGYNLNRGDGLNFGKEWRIPFQPFVQEEKSAIIMTTHAGGWDMSHHPPSQNQSLTSPYHHNHQTCSAGTLLLV